MKAHSDESDELEKSYFQLNGIAAQDMFSL